MNKGIPVALIFVIIVSLTAATFAPSIIQITIPTSGTITTEVSIGIYFDSDCNEENKVNSISWGSLEPGSVKNHPVYLKNKGNTATTLTLGTDSWSSSEAQSNMDLTWNYNDTPINPNEIRLVTLSLSVDSDIADVADFSFDIVIIAN